MIARRKIGFNLRNWIVWHYTFGQQTKLMFAKSHTHILYFTKDRKDFTFNADAVRVASARQTTYGDARANPKGKLPDDVWFLRPQETPAEYFAVRWRHLERQPCVRNFQGAGRVARLPDADRGAGSHHPRQQQSRRYGARSVQWQRDDDRLGRDCSGRQFIGIDQSEEYVAYARKRLEHSLKQAKAIASSADSAVNPDELFAKDRASRVMTQTDAFGRPRVPRGPRKHRGKMVNSRWRP